MYRHARPGRSGLPAARAAHALAAILLLLTGARAVAQDVTQPALKAAFIYKFAMFTEWPTGAVPAGEPLVMCVVGDEAVGEALARAVKGRALTNRGITVQTAPARPQPGCHLVYVSGITARQAEPIVANLRNTHVLTLSDIGGFTDVGGIAEFYFERGQLRFKVRQEWARRAGLQISSRLLALSK